ncbi:unnamed protein product (macronuclear) [Paramecium tetraurelia]|uniref:C3H1-type domain-containing protein n=1 Tax=Paramecium tetraurelia TaxID=5888 RepID=A0EAR0_PARTE|nr:uncharacterized protein GSPATT00025111001 [Paramecium tetraurelia]CAK92377.1 unnamed protein product [Paramecium tetraurelia]|eukprot:XP_001459774.1 hypothetical protein (macronuclear) [Paramecium tetraurelia strain d4-2]
MQIPRDQMRKGLQKYNSNYRNQGNRRQQTQNLMPPDVIPKGMLSMNSGLKTEKNTKLNETETTDVTHNNLGFSQQLQQQVRVEHLDLGFFKVQPCKVMGNHNHKQCPFFHNPKDRKRVAVEYSADLCQYIENNSICPYGDNCNRAHNRVEQLYRVDNYKTKFCSYYPNNILQCDYGKFCSFAHSEGDIAIELIHNLEYDDDFFIFYYKTVWCPFNLTQHDKSLCVYAHNWQDFRRKPQGYNYIPQSCPNWNTNEYITEYSYGCPDAFNCTKCHGWKELEYHPILFRTKQCVNSNCNKQDCSFYHHQQERRYIEQSSQSRIFRIVPRNRIIQNVFKVRERSLQTSQRNQKSQDTCSDQQQWLSHNLQNSFQYEPESDTVVEFKNKGEHYQTALISILERTDSEELKDLMRKKSFSVDIIDDNEQIRGVLKMIDLDS